MHLAVAMRACDRGVTLLVLTLGYGHAFMVAQSVRSDHDRGNRPHSVRTRAAGPSRHTP